jgi:hypothetical protein
MKITKVKNLTRLFLKVGINFPLLILSNQTHTHQLVITHTDCVFSRMWVLEEGGGGWLSAACGLFHHLLRNYVSFYRFIDCTHEET